MPSSPLASPWKRSLVCLASLGAGSLLTTPSLGPLMPQAAEVVEAELVALLVGCVTSLLCSLLVVEAVVAVPRMKMQRPLAVEACD